MIQEQTHPQGTTDHDIAATRVARSVSFLVVVMAYGLVLTFLHLKSQQPGQTFYGVGLLLTGGIISVMSKMGITITHWLRRVSFVLLCGLLISMDIWNWINLKYQAATLLLYPIAICVIEVSLAAQVMYRKRHERG